MKKCSKCQVVKEDSSFYKDAAKPDGLYPSCKDCARAVKAAYLNKPGMREKERERISKWVVENQEKVIKARKKWLNENKDKSIASTLRWQRENRERVRQIQRDYYERNREIVIDRKKKLIAANKPKDAAKSAMRRFNRSKATPSWANKFFISEAYHLAALRSQLFGFKWHVDHIVPLKGKNVCGLHVENNLQVIPAVENIRKKNHFQGE